MNKNFWLKLLKLQNKIDINSIAMFEACLDYHSKSKASIRTERTKLPIYLDYWNFLVKYEKIKHFSVISSFDNLKLVGDYLISPVVNENNSKIIFILHGITNTRFWLFKQAYEFLQSGYNVIWYDARNHGESGSAITSFGKNEAADLQDVINFVVQNYNPQEIILYGYSLGGATILMWGEYYLQFVVNKKVKLIICDAVFARLSKIYIDKINNHQYLPTNFMVKLLKRQVKKGFGNDNLHILEPIRYLKYFAKVPAIFIHGKSDKFINYTNSQELYEEKIRYETPVWSKLFLVSDAGHGQTFLVSGADGIVVDEYNKTYDEPLIAVLLAYMEKILK